MIRRRHQLLGAAAFLAVALLWPSLNSAQEEPIVIGQRRELQRFHLERPIFTLELFSQYAREETTVPGGSFTSSELLFEETLRADTTGYILHPNFISLDLGGSFGLTQSFIEVNDDSERESGTVYTWDVSATFLPDRDTPLTLYSHRVRRLVNRQFGPTVESTVTTSGARLDIRSRSAPTHFDLSRTVTEQSSVTGQPEYKLTRDRFLWNTNAQLSHNQRLHWNYVFSHVEQEGLLDRTYDTHDAVLRHEYFFGPRQVHSLQSTINYDRQDGDFEYERFRLNERLWLRHSANFETRYHYTFENNRFVATEQTRHQVSADFVHRLFASLTTRGRIGAQRIEAAGDSTEYFASLNMDYRKRVPLGTFRLSPSVAYSLRENDAIGSPTAVVDQSRAFDDGTPIIIVGPNLDPDTLIVRDPVTLFTYVPGIDYTVTALPDRLEIDRIIGGRIPPASPVLLNYVLPPVPESTITTTSYSIAARYDLTETALRGLGFYGRYTDVSQDIDTLNPALIVPASYRDTLIGMEYRVRDATVGIERQWHDSVVAPFDATRLFARLTTRLQAETTLSLSSQYQMLDYREPQRSIDVFTASATVRHRFNRNFFAVGSLLYRHQDDDFGGSQGFEQQLELEWKHRQTTIYATLRNALLESDAEDSNFQLFLVGLRREF